MSEREVLSFRSIAAIDGGVIEVAFNQALNQILNDLRDRPGLDKKRSITLQVDLFPVCEHGHLARTDIEFQVKTSAPARKTISYPFKADRRGLTFFPDVADNPDQQPLPFGSDEEDES